MLVLGIDGNAIIPCMCAFETSLVSPNFVRRIFLARLHPLVVNGNLFIEALTFGTTSSFRYENFVTTDNFDLSILHIDSRIKHRLEESY